MPKTWVPWWRRFEQRAAEMRFRLHGPRKPRLKPKGRYYPRRAACACGTCRNCHRALYAHYCRYRAVRPFCWLWERATAEWRPEPGPSSYEIELASATRFAAGTFVITQE